MPHTQHHTTPLADIEPNELLIQYSSKKIDDIMMRNVF